MAKEKYDEYTYQYESGWEFNPNDAVELDSTALYFDWTDNNKHQSEFIFYNPEKSPYALCGSGGMGGGKTVGLVRRTILHLINTPIFGNCNGNVGCIGRLKRLDFERTTLPELKKWLPREWIAREDSKIGRLDLINGSTLFYAHFDDISPIISLNLGFVAIDQMEEVPEEVFDELFYRRIRLKTMKRFQEDGSPINPTFDVYGRCTSVDEDEVAAVFTGQNVFGVCNPRRCFIMERFVKNRKKLESGDENVVKSYNPAYKLMDMPAMENQRYVPESYFEQQKADLSDKAFGRFVLGSWDCWEGQVYVDFLDRNILKENLVPDISWEILVGIDHGGTGMDSKKVTGLTAVVFIALEPRVGDFPKVHVIEELYLMSSTIEQTVGEIDTTLRKIYTQQYWKKDGNIPGGLGERVYVSTWRCDPSMNRTIQDSDETIMERYINEANARGMFMPLSGGSNDIADNIERVSWLFRKNIADVSPKCKEFIDEHKSLEYGNNEKPKAAQRDHLTSAFWYITSGMDFLVNRAAAPQREKTNVERILENAVKQQQNDYSYEA